MAVDDALQAQLHLARPFLRGTYDAIDPSLPAFMSVLRSSGASECWHKHGTFFEHLLDVYRILKLWRAPDPVSRCGLFHSAYSNSYVNLAIFQPDVERHKVRDIIGDPAEHLVHLFCIVPRHALIHDMLLFQFTDDELLSALHGHALPLRNGNLQNGHANSAPGTGNDGDKFRDKLREIIPPEGITLKHIRTGEDVHLSRSLIAVFLFLTMADFIDQLTGWQDTLFANESGTLTWGGNNWTALWPGDGKPGLWMSAISRMGVLLNLMLQEESENKKSGEDGIKIEVPPVFNNCTAILDPADQIKARDLYWEAIHMKEGEKTMELAEPLLSEACKLNPWIGEPHVLLAQIYISQGKFELAEMEASKGLHLLLQWGTNWDKRISWEGWVAWSRVLKGKAESKSWPKSAWGVMNLGLVK